MPKILIAMGLFLIASPLVATADDPKCSTHNCGCYEAKDVLGAPECKSKKMRRWCFKNPQRAAAAIKCREYCGEIKGNENKCSQS